MNQAAIYALGIAMIATLAFAARMNASAPPSVAHSSIEQASELARTPEKNAEQPSVTAESDVAAADQRAVYLETSTSAATIDLALVPEIKPVISYRTARTTTAPAPATAPIVRRATPSEDQPVLVEEETVEIDPDAVMGQPTGPDIASLSILEAEVEPGTLAQLQWKPRQTFDGIARGVPVLVARGSAPGPTMCFTAAVHGDELNGIEVVRRVLYEVNPEKLTGTLIGVPIVNLQGFSRNSRYLPDRRDLNRHFPGNPKGSAASRLAYSFFNEVIRHCHTLVDLHTGSFHRTNLPQIRANLTNEDVVTLTQGFGSTLVLQSEGPIGTLRRSAVDAGIPAVTFEIGEPMRLQDDQVKHAVKAVFSLLDEFNVYGRRSLWGAPEPVYYQSKWVRADTGGILFSQVSLGEYVRFGGLLGTVTDPITNEAEEIAAPFTGRVIGMAVDQFVMPGYAAYHIGIETEVTDDTLEDVIEEPGPDFDHAE